MGLKKMTKIRYLSISILFLILITLCKTQFHYDLKPVKANPQVFTEDIWDFQGIQFVAELALGSNKQVMKFIPDTGSSAVWFFSDKDPKSERPPHAKTFACRESDTCQNSNKVTSL